MPSPLHIGMILAFVIMFVIVLLYFSNVLIDKPDAVNHCSRHQPLDVNYKTQKGIPIHACSMMTNRYTNSTGMIFSIEPLKNGILTLDVPRSFYSDYYRNDADLPLAVFAHSEIVMNFTIPKNENQTTVDIPFYVHQAHPIYKSFMISIAPLYEAHPKCHGKVYPGCIFDFPPLEKFNLGLKLENICDETHQLVFKKHGNDDTPACIKHESAQKLVGRNWAKIPS